MKNVKTWKKQSREKRHILAANKEWVDEECAKVNVEKNAARK
jgi:hypothetical protein